MDESDSTYSTNRTTTIVVTVLVTVIVTIVVLFILVGLIKTIKFGYCKNEVKLIRKEVKEYGKDCKAGGIMP